MRRRFIAAVLSSAMAFAWPVTASAAEPSQPTPIGYALAAVIGAGIGAGVGVIVGAVLWPAAGAAAGAPAAASVGEAALISTEAAIGAVIGGSLAVLAVR
jgi:hypothetical protein